MKSFCIIFIILFSNVCHSQSDKDDIPFVMWAGTNPVMTIQDLASYCAPVFWFSSDEPELQNKWMEDIEIPAGFPFETHSDSPVVYYQYASVILSRKGVDPIKRNYENPGSTTVDLSQVAAFEIYYSHYYPNEAGLGGHRHDTEQAQFKFLIRKVRKDTSQIIYQVVLQQVTAKAHALAWYDNVWKLDTNSTEIVLPVHILVEEGKHASCTDMNADGIYTPGYDVNVRTNDAWGVRDVIRTGALFVSNFESYLAKPRIPEYKVFPPLPKDSPLRKWYIKNGIYAKGNAVYQLRPYPNPWNVRDKHLKEDMSGYYVKTAFEVREEDILTDWIDKELFIKSFAIAARYDKDDLGLSFCFPLFIVKNVEMPLIGGWVVNRVYASDTNFRDIGYNILVTSSASRFLDPYFSAGVELDVFSVDTTRKVTKVYPVFETGIKLRGNVKYSFLKFLSLLSDFWGFRIGIKNTGFPDINNLNYIFEIGAGVW